jgi:hypothetical protein
MLWTLIAIGVGLPAACVLAALRIGAVAEEWARQWQERMADVDAWRWGA